MYPYSISNNPGWVTEQPTFLIGEADERYYSAFSKDDEEYTMEEIREEDERSEDNSNQK